ncbi:hypothetical protein FVR03_14335 [Pontibacter qinzhouensis]|uniref:Uncharacterized protein n=1 Tax=Pontibacter qinzhouensis TaxID=2603253 RepID=A0A5C8JMN7_9BACT|nr:hypothetical protein [Pontibacter qinzhouensis]TXK37987.1 hypothetical protein FVR03_14335 [Pontibacter qinzhouensis]
MTHTCPEFAEIHTTAAGAVYQCNRKNRLVLQFAGGVSVLKVDAFLRLSLAVEAIDLDSMVVSTDRASDLEIISVCGCDRCFVLTLPELLAFKELLAGAKFSLQLNSMLHECLNPLFV